MNFEPSVEEEPTSNRNPNLALALHTPPTAHATMEERSALSVSTNAVRIRKHSQ